MAAQGLSILLPLIAPTPAAAAAANHSDLGLNSYAVAVVANLALEGAWWARKPRARLHEQTGLHAIDTRDDFGPLCSFQGDCAAWGTEWHRCSGGVTQPD